MQQKTLGPLIMERLFSYPLVALLAVLFHSVAAASATGTNFSVFDGTVYSYTDGHVRAMRLLTKAELWKSAVPGNSLDTIPVMDSGALVFCAGGAAQRIVSLEIATGKLRWNKDGFCRAVVAHAGKVYILPDLTAPSPHWTARPEGPFGEHPESVFRGASLHERVW
jgi:hypothetical protein